MFGALKRNSRGLTLLELVVAIVVLSLGALAALRAGDQARLSLGGAEARVLARIAVQNQAALLQAQGLQVAGPSEVSLGRAAFAVRTETRVTAAGLTEATITARSDQGPGAVLVIYLPGGGV